jgi:signal recognition particle subunit SRP54
MIPGVPKPAADQVDEGKLARTEAIIRSMTAQERRRPEILDGSRRRRVARGSGTTVQEVNELLRQFKQARRMMRAFAAGGSKPGWKSLAKGFRK